MEGEAGLAPQASAPPVGPASAAPLTAVTHNYLTQKGDGQVPRRSVHRTACER